MYSAFLRFLLILAFCVWLPARGQSAPPQDAPQNGGDFSTITHPTEKQKVPAGVILVKGAWASASDSVTPLPEGGSVANDTFTDPYFGITYTPPTNWTEKHKGPPPSDSGRYVLAIIAPSATYEGPSRASILITAQDMFFTPLPVSNAQELIRYTKDNLQADYQVELKPTETKIGGRPFTFFAYWSPVAELHWYVVATQIRCHSVEFVLTSRDTKLLQNLIVDMEKIKLPAEASPTGGMGGGDFPVCIKDYARDQNVIERVDPVFSEHRFNAAPVRIIIDKKGKVKHIHFLSAFPEQAKAVSDALAQWKFRPYLRDGQPVEVETGILFGQQPRRPATTKFAAVSE
jgi:hypothetical protein